MAGQISLLTSSDGDVEVKQQEGTNVVEEQPSTSSEEALLDAMEVSKPVPDHGFFLLWACPRINGGSFIETPSMMLENARREEEDERGEEAGAALIVENEVKKKTKAKKKQTKSTRKSRKRKSKKTARKREDELLRRSIKTHSILLQEAEVEERRERELDAELSMGDPNVYDPIASIGERGGIARILRDVETLADGERTEIMEETLRRRQQEGRRQLSAEDGLVDGDEGVPEGERGFGQ